MLRLKNAEKERQMSGEKQAAGAARERLLRLGKAAATAQVVPPVSRSKAFFPYKIVFA